MREHIFTIRLSKEERIQLGIIAEKFHMKPAGLIRAFINGEIISSDEDTLKRIVKKVSKDFVG